MPLENTVFYLFILFFNSIPTIFSFVPLISHREFEQQRELREKGFQTINDQSVHAEPAEKEASAMETDIGHIEKV